MLSFLSSIAVYRLKGEYGYTANLPKLSGDKLQNFKKQNSNNIVFYADLYEDLDFADNIINKFNKSVNFARAFVSEADEKECDTFPCIICYRNGAKVGLQGPNHYNGLYTWVMDLIHPKTVELKHQEDVRLFFNKCGSFVLAVDTDKRPSQMKESETLYTVSSKLLKYFNINVKGGIYVYRSADRNLVRVNGNFRNYMRTKIVDPRNYDLSQRKFTAGFFIDDFNNENNEKEMKILEQLAGQFSEVNFLPIAGGMFSIFNEIGKADYLQYPLFGMLHTEESEKGRWFVRGEDAHNITLLSNVIRGAIDGTIESYNISEEIDPSNKHQMTYNTYDKIIEENGKELDTVVAYVTFYMETAHWFEKLIEVSDDIIKDSRIRFYVYNLSINDAPADLGKSEEPIVMMYRKGWKAPLQYNGGSSIESYINWVCQNAENRPNAPEYDPEHYMREVLPPLPVGGFDFNFDDDMFQMPEDGQNEDDNSYLSTEEL